MNIAKMIEQFEDEVAGVREYSCMSRADDAYAGMYMQMASQELEHARMLGDAISEELGKDRTADEAKTCLSALAEGFKDLISAKLSKAEGEAR